MLPREDKLGWARLPGELRARVEGVLGSRVQRATFPDSAMFWRALKIFSPSWARLRASVSRKPANFSSTAHGKLGGAGVARIHRFNGRIPAICAS